MLMRVENFKTLNLNMEVELLIAFPCELRVY